MSERGFVGSALVGLSVFLLLGCQAGDGAREPESLGREAGNPPVFWRNQSPELRLVRETPAGLELTLRGGGARVGLRRVEDRLFSTLSCADCGWTNELGKPRLPVIRRFVEVEPGQRLEAKLQAAGWRTLSLAELGAAHMLLPVQRPVEKKPGALENASLIMDEELYAEDAFYPEEPVQVGGPFIMRGHWLYLVEVRPYAYNPWRNEIRLAEQAELALLTEGEAAPELVRQREALRAPAFEDWLSTQVLNARPRGLTRGLSTAKYAEGVLFVVGNAYAADAGLLNYIATREAEGHKVVTVPMSSIGTTASALRSYIQGEYASWAEPPLSMVVLVGDIADVPTYVGSAGGGWDDQATDLYYASIDPGTYTSDILAPDLFVSRISVNNATELGTYIDRAYAYIYADFPNDLSWMRKLAFLASCDNANITEGTHNYAISNYTAPAGYTGTQPNNPMAGGDQLYCGNGDAGTSDITSALGDGRLIINFSGHGDNTYWADPSFDSLSGITPPDAAPFVVSNACLTGSFDYSSDCWGEQWLAHSHGAILFWGGSNSTYWDEDDILEKNMWDGILRDGITRFGPLTRNALVDTLAHYGTTNDDSMEYYFEIYNLLGDGTIDLYTDIPFDPTVIYATELPIGLDQMDFTVTDAGTAVEGALVHLYGGGVRQVGTTDAAGQVTLQMNPAPDTVGELQVVITGHNLRRYEGSVLVISADGPYLTHAAHELTSDGATPVTPNPGRNIIMPISVRNVGSESAVGATGSLVCETPALATVTSDNVVFPDAAPDETVRSNTHPEFQIASDAPDGAMITFRLDWTTSGGDSGITRFGVGVVKPQLFYSNHTVSDADSGCDADGIADMGEPTVFELTLRNEGSGDASDVSVNMVAPDCAISGPVSVGSIPAGGQALAQFTVTPATSIACPAPDVLFTLYASAAELGQPDESSFVELLNADIELGAYADDMEGTEPNGWSHSAAIGSDDWRYVTSSSHSPSHAWFAADVASEKDASLYSPTLTIGDTAQLSFWHRFDFEDGFDGGVLEISVDGGSFTDLGPYITQNGYNDTLSGWSNPLGDRDAWSGTAAWQQVLVDLSDFGPAEIILRFRLACDSSVAGVGWWIDDVAVDAETVVCNVAPCGSENTAPTADAGEDQALTEDDTVHLDGSGSSDPENNPLSYLWTQLSGTTVSLSDPALVNPSFTPPDVSETTVLSFQLVVSDWQLSSEPDVVNITIEPVNHRPVADAGADRQVDALSTVVLDGSGSLDPDSEDTLDYQWSQLDGPAVSLSDPQVASPSFTAPDIQGLITLVFELQVSDGELSDSDTVSISVWGECDDGLLCTDDSFDGTECVFVARDCDDGNPCTADSCDDEQGCLYETLADCALCGADGVCMGGECIAGGQIDPVACDDGDACTQSDTCQAGACLGADPVICEAADACHEVGVCDPATGACSSPVSEDGKACDDDNLCTQLDTCQAGVCVGSEPIVCEPEDDCHEQGFCNAETGECRYPQSEDGKACDDGDPCTQSGVCADGLCEPGEPVVCEAQDECHEAGVCDPQAGGCTHPAVEDGKLCDDGAGTCQAGVCEPIEDEEDPAVEGGGCGCATGADSSGAGFGFGLLLLGLFRLAATRRRRT